jgi:antitoxin component of MazEF toxin-antitoxin module
MLREKVKISEKRLDEINNFLLDPSNKLINDLLDVIEKYGGVDEINNKAEEAGKLENILGKLIEKRSPYIKDLEWLSEKRDNGEFISVKDFRRKVLGNKADSLQFNDGNAVTLEISACQYFPFLITEAKHALEHKELMPGRFIRVRAMKEQEADNDLLAVSAAMKIIDASWCETLDTKGTDGSNIHLGGAETITGYFGGVGQPNDYPIKWADEFLYYYTNYGIKQVLNVNLGTILVGYLLHKLDINVEFKISVFAGNDNPYFFLTTLLLAKLFSREDGSTSLIGLNPSNSVNNKTLEESDAIRKAFGFEDSVRFEHHILESQKSIVKQPYDRRNELMELASKVKNISAKHEGGDLETEAKREHPSDILDYFLPKDGIDQNLMNQLLQNYMDKHQAINNTAKALTEHGLSFVAAKNLHR